jgi:predicted HTH domain antitoxin
MGYSIYHIEKKRRVCKDEALEVLVTRFYKRGNISLHEGAVALGITKSEFIDLLHKFEIPVTDNNPLNVGF